MTKEEMVNDLAEAIVSKVYFDVEDKEKENLLCELSEEFMYLEESSLATCVEFVKAQKNGITKNELMNKFGFLGLLKVKPKLIHEDGEIPSIQIRYDKFLHWFRGYGFQVSDTPTGQGDSGNSGTSMRFDLEVVENLPKEIIHLVALSHALQAGNRYDLWRAILSEDLTLLDSFMHVTAKEARLPTKDFNSEVFLNTVTTEDGINGNELHRLFLCETPSLVKKSPLDRYRNNVFGSISLGEDYVALGQFKNSHWRMIKFPAWYEETDENWETYDLPSRGDYYKVLWERLTWVLLAVDSIILSMFYVYPITKEGKISVPLNTLESDKSVVIKSNHDLWNFLDGQQKILNQVV